MLLLLCHCQNSGTPETILIGDDANWSEESDFEEKVSTYEDENRDVWQKPEHVLDILGPLDDKTVVDLGAGSGYFAFRLVPKAQKVIAVEIDPKFVGFLQKKKEQLPSAQQDKFEVRLATPTDARLEDAEADAVLLVSTYAYMSDRVQYFRNLKPKLSDEGKVVIIEFKMKDIRNGPPRNEKVSIATVEEELKKAGYTRIETDDQTLDYQYIIVARK